jgi:hypothetical protein
MPIPTIIQFEITKKVKKKSFLQKNSSAMAMAVAKSKFPKFDFFK